MNTSLIRHFGLATLAGVVLGLAACTSGESGETTSAAEPVVDNLASLVDDEPLDQLQVLLDQLLIDTVAAALPEYAGDVLTALTSVTLELVDTPDELLEALLLAGDLLSQGEIDPALYSMVLSDAGDEMIVHVQTAAFDLLNTLLFVAANGPAADVTDAVIALTGVTDVLDDPSGIADPVTLLEPLSAAAIALADLSAADLGLPEQAQAPVDVALSLLTGSLVQVTSLLTAITDDSVTLPTDALIDPILGLLDGISSQIPTLNAVLGALEDRTGVDPVVATLGLVTEITRLLDTDSAVQRVTDLISPLLALLGPLTGSFSDVFCGLLPVCD